MKSKTLHHIEYLDVNLGNETALFSFFTTRRAGVSSGEYASLNLGNTSDDRPDLVIRNRELFSNTIGIRPENLFIPRQTHSNNVAVISSEFLLKDKVEQLKKLENIDALITNIPEVCIGVTTADCVPVLIYDTKQKVFAAIHSGWKGTVQKISSKTIDTMVSQFGCEPKNLVAAIGPSISMEKFEVGDEVVERFAVEGFYINDIAARNKQSGKMHIDLWKANVLILENSGIKSENIQVAAICTYSDPERFFSARRQSIHSGRMLAGGYIRR